MPLSEPEVCRLQTNRFASVGVYGWKKRAKDYIKWFEVDKGGQVVVLGVGVNLYNEKSKMKETTCQ